MLNRQETLLSSSSRRQTPPENNQHAKAIGCMSRLLQLVSKYPRHRRKFLTFGRKQEKNAVSRPSHWGTGVDNYKTEQASRNVDARRFASNLPRSPTLPAELRRSNSTESSRMSPPLTEESAAEKRRKLLGAIEKCDEDLKALKKIIEAVRLAENLRSPAMARTADGVGDGASPQNVQLKMDDNIRSTSGDRLNGRAINNVVKCSEFNGEQPSPVSVLDEFVTRSPLSKRCSNGRVLQQQRLQLRKKPGEEDTGINVCLAEVFQAKQESNAASVPLWSSKAMVESVQQVCRDIAWGEKREVGRIGLALQDSICRDLIEEIVTELLGWCCVYSLPLEACKRRLCF